MKYRKIFRILGIAIILSLLVLATPVAPAQAARDIELDPEEGKIGEDITVSGTDFNASSEDVDKYATIYFSSQEADTFDDIDDEVDTYEKIRDGVWLDEEGNFETTFEVPDRLTDGDDNEDVTSGTYYVYICHFGYTRISAVAEFTVIGGEIEIDPEEGPVGTPVDITGTDFAAEEEIVIEYDGDEVDIEDGDDETDDDGEFLSVILIPDSNAGTHTITVVISGSEVEAEFTVEPEVVLEPTSGEAGSKVTVSGTGFGKRQDVTVWFRTTGLATQTTDRDGTFTTTFTVPDLAAGIYDIDVEDEDENLDKAKFTITVAPPPTPAPTPAPTPEPEPAPAPAPAPTPPPSTTTGSISTDTGNIGSDLLISGVGFDGGAEITVKYDEEEVTKGTATAEGVFIAGFKVPVSKGGEHIITASDGTNTLELTFTVESETPETPMPLTPAMGVEVKSPIFFDWEDVTDDSLPVTYELQIGTNTDFTESSTLLEKKALTSSEYTLTEEEGLKLGSPETTHYWRVRALDAASNESLWTGGGEFYVTTPFGIPDWAKYTMFGIGGLLLFGIGYWLGRRTAFYY